MTGSRALSRLAWPASLAPSLSRIWLTITLTLSVLLVPGAGTSVAALTPVDRVYALVLAIGQSEQSLLAAEQPLERCSRKGHRACLPAAARELGRVAAREQAPVRKATRIQQGCGRRAGLQYLKALRLTRAAAHAFERAKSKKARISAAVIFTRADRLDTSAVKKAQNCWRALR
jgi:hypothetical protein